MIVVDTSAFISLATTDTLLPREERPLDAVVPLSVLVDAVLTALTDSLERIGEIIQNIEACEWYQELRADFEDTRAFADEHGY